MSNTAYSDLKSAWHLDKIQAMRDGEQIAPVELQFIISDFCNHDCHFCAYRASNGLSSQGFAGPDKDGNLTHNPNRMIATGKAREILSDAAEMGVKSVIFTGGGEPTVHPDHMDLFEYALSLGMDCSLNTNGCIFREGWEKILPRFKYVRFSVDAANSAEYAKIRRVKESAYTRALTNMRHLVNEVKVRATDCVVGVGYVVTPENFVNLREGVTHIRKTGADYVRLASMQSTDGIEAFGGSVHEAASSECSSVAESLGTDSFSVVNLFDSRLGTKPESMFCGFQQFVVYIGGNMKVYRCCYTAYTDLGEIGDLSEQSFREWFDSADKKHLINSFNAQDCETCPLDDKNKVINYMLDPDPMHVNFV